MRRKTRSAIMMAGAVGLCLGGVAQAALVEGLEVLEPKIVDEGVVGPSTTLSVFVPPGMASANTITDGEPLEVYLIGLDPRSGALVPGLLFEVSAGIVEPANYNDAAGNTIAIGLDGLAVSLFFNTVVANKLRIGVVVKTADIPGVANNGITTAFDPDDPAADETLTPDIFRPALIGAYISADGEAAYFVFSEPLNNGSADNDDNHTIIADIDATDLQVRMTLPFDGTELPPTGLLAPSFLAGSNNTVIAFDRDPLASTLGVGSYVRPNFSDAGITASNDFYDIVSNRATATAVQVAAIDFGIEILSQPGSVLLPASGGTAAFTVEASGFGFDYQWLRDGEPLVDDGVSILGANASELVILASDAGFTGLYTCIVSSGVHQDAVQSNPAVLALRPPCAGDLNGDGVVDVNDLGILLNAFGSVCP